jgi:thymidylate kinase
VEFLGLPGAGKSALSSRVAARLAARGRDVAQPSFDLNHRMGAVRRRATRLALACGEALAHPARARASARTIAATAPVDRGDFGRNLTAWLLAQALMRRHAPGRVTLLDQGLFQAIWSIQWSAARPLSAPDALIDSGLTHPLTVVVVESTAALVRERLSARRQRASRLERDLSDGALARAVAIVEDTRTLLQRAAARHRDLRIVAVDRTRESCLDDAAEELARQLESGERP